MNVVLNNNFLLINSGKDGAGNFNTLWGLEYLLMNETRFITDNLEAIVEIMVKNRTTLAS